MNKLLIVLLASAFLFSCGREKERLMSKVDSLQNELIVRDEMQNTLNQIGLLIDSIDANRNAVRVDLLEGTTYGQYSKRMEEINKYVLDSETKLEELESKSKQNSAFRHTIRKLKFELGKRNDEIVELKERVDELGTQNENMKITIDDMGNQLIDRQAQIDVKIQELALIEARIQELMIESRMSEADSYFARAQAVEEAARRTKLAPRKKKESLREALELYQKSMSLGKDSSQVKIDELTKRLK